MAVAEGLVIAQLLLQAYFSYMEQQGKTAEELDKLYNDERTSFYANKPEDLPNPV